MVECVFCVDFGSAYTKVALRPAVRESGDLIPCGDSAVELWVPTVVAADYSTGETAAGVRVQGRGHHGPARASAYSRTSRKTYSPRPGPSRPPFPRSNRLLQSDDFATLAVQVRRPTAGGDRAEANAGRGAGIRRALQEQPERRGAAASGREGAHRSLHEVAPRARAGSVCEEGQRAAAVRGHPPARRGAGAGRRGRPRQANPGCARFREALERHRVEARRPAVRARTGGERGGRADQGRQRTDREAQDQLPRDVRQRPAHHRSGRRQAPPQLPRAWWSTSGHSPPTSRPFRSTPAGSCRTSPTAPGSRSNSSRKRWA